MNPSIRSLATATLLLATQTLALAADGAANDRVEAGRRIYEEGVLSSGAALKGMRFDNVEVSGADAACMTCHRRSGMGGVEGDLQVPPINGRFLYAQRGDMALAIMDPRIGRKMNRFHEPYTDAALAATIRGGVNISGMRMNVAMPHFALGDADMQALIAYLKSLSAQWSPGVSDEEIRFATVITPGVAPERRRILLDQLAAAVAQKNGSTIVAGNAPKNPGRRHMVSAAELVLGTERKWALDVWELQGAPETWRSQLEQRYRTQPVFALLSGLGAGTWQPVHDFCERERVPCWFPSVLMAPETGKGGYSIYFSRGLGLEAEVLAEHLREAKPVPRRLLQVYGGDGAARAAGQVLRRALAGSNVAVEDVAVDAGNPGAWRKAVAGAGSEDAVMLWLTADELVAQAKAAAPAGRIYVSNLLGEADRVRLPDDWKARIRYVYGYELPAKRAPHLSYFETWRKMRRLPLVDAALQSEAYFAVTFMSDTVAEMLDNLHRDYLIERAEDMIVRRETGKSEGETRERTMLGTPEQMAKRYPKARRLDEAAGLSMEPGQAPAMMTARGGTTVYPRLALGPGQRYASKGGYIVKVGADGALAAESDWIVPR